MINFLMLACACGFTACSGIGALQEKQYNNIEEKIEFKQDNKRLVSYDDANYTITLNADELNNYTFENLANYFNAQFLSAYENILIENSVEQFSFTYSDYTINDYILWNQNDYDFRLVLNSSDEFYSKFRFAFEDGDDYIYEDVAFSLDFIIPSNIYSSIKQAIELDIQANTAGDNMPAVLGDFVSILIGGIQTLATGVANGVVSMATALFLTMEDGQVTGLSVFGGIVAIFAGLALAIGITTKVYTWVTSLGN